jgi:fructose-1,6-bisphosphatase/inositol monophosphatase family enzyme
MKIDDVTEILREAAATAILPRFGTLAAGEVSEKTPGELVTVADREAEALISHRLRELLDAPVVGEEATAADPTLPRALTESPAAWVVDPIDGTGNFVAGRPEFAVMAALVRDGETIAAWILRPVDGTAYVAERGSGAWRDGTRLLRSPAPATAAELHGDVLTRFLDGPARARVTAAAPRFASLGRGASCAGVDYPRVIEGERDFVLYQRILPWDHAPGTLLLEEAGGHARHLDGSPYRPGENRTGLLAAADPNSWERVRALLT